MATTTIPVGDRDLSVSNLDKQLYPSDGFSKGDVLDYYRSVASDMVRHLRGRPLTLRRFPDGIEAEGFFQKEAADFFPAWIRTRRVPHRHDHGSTRYVVCDDEETLLYLANLGTLEFHIGLSQVDKIARPDLLVIDVDPPDGTPLSEIREITRAVRKVYEALDLVPFTQATGGRGYHVVAALDRSGDYDMVRPLARRMADFLAAHDQDRLTTEQRKQQRGDRVFLDTNRNGRRQTMIAPYSLRARPGAPVATPIDWSELRRVDPNHYRLDSVPRRLRRKVDPWADLSQHATPARQVKNRINALTR
ncbi:MAG: ATP-dependent DNA ligase [Pseudonocardiaceae bacterium]|nr:ATP-dependent DNA ligase [Pseudonocardiaceae bacterium]